MVSHIPLKRCLSLCFEKKNLGYDIYYNVFKFDDGPPSSWSYKIPKTVLISWMECSKHDQSYVEIKVYAIGFLWEWEKKKMKITL